MVRLSRLSERVADTDIALGSDIMSVALQAYGLLKVTGILTNHADDSWHDKITDSILSQPVLDRMLNYVDLTILTAEGKIRH